MTREFTPPYTPLAKVDNALRERGFALLDRQSVQQWLDCNQVMLDEIHTAWTDLPQDTYLRDGGSYRRRRHSSFIVEGEAATMVPHRAHWQPLDYNALHGGMQRWFDPIQPEIVSLPLWLRVLTALAIIASNLRGAQRWYVEAHPFRIDTADGIGRPTPEGAHRDGVDLVAVFMVHRERVKGGESRVFDADGPAGQRFTLLEPWSLMLLDDARVVHETTPIQPLEADRPGWRDTLVVTLRSDGFQDAE